MNRRPTVLTLTAMAFLLLLLTAACAGQPAAPAESAEAETSAGAAEEAPVAIGDIQDLPREKTFISQGWDFYNQVPSPTNFNPYAG
ncbi:MAG: hypothetical protein ACK2UI_08135, partial [Anaerolineae bacterium]